MKESTNINPRLKSGADDFFLKWHNSLSPVFAGGLLIALLAQPIAAQTPARSTSATTLSAPDDRAPLTVRYAAADKLRDFQNSREYQYDYEAKPAENPLLQFWYWFLRKLGEFFVSKSYLNFWQYVILAALGGLVVWLLAKAQVLGFLFAKKSESLPLDYDTLTEDIHAIDFAGSIEQAIEARNFRLAVRLLYLQTLKRLTDAGRITWKPDKTNRHYVQEMKSVGFEQLTTQFEYVWYGDFPVDERRFSAIRDEFKRFS